MTDLLPCPWCGGEFLPCTDAASIASDDVVYGLVRPWKLRLICKNCHVTVKFYQEIIDAGHARQVANSRPSYQVAHEKDKTA